MAYNNRGSGGGRNGYGNRPYYDEPKLPDGYLKDGYFNITPSGKTIKTELVREVANDIAQKLNVGRTQLKKSQLRKYYDYCKSLQDKMHAKRLGYDAIEADFSKLGGYVTNAKNKSTPLVPQLFFDFVDKNINKVKDADDYKAFIAHFEMIVAYYPRKD